MVYVLQLPIDVSSEIHLDIVPDHVEALRHGPAMALTDDHQQVVVLLTAHVKRGDHILEFFVMGIISYQAILAPPQIQ